MTKRKLSGPLTTSEVENQKKFWVKREQQQVKDTEKFKINQERLDSQENTAGIYICKGRIKGEQPIVLPYKSELSEKAVATAHMGKK